MAKEDIRDVQKNLKFSEEHKTKKCVETVTSKRVSGDSPASP
jgi:hypothetical protein